MNRKGFNYVTFLFALIAIVVLIFIVAKYFNFFGDSAEENIGSCSTPINKCACVLTGTESCPSQGTVRSYRTQDCPLNCEQGEDISGFEPVEEQEGLCCVTTINEPWEQ